MVVVVVVVVAVVVAVVAASLNVVWDWWYLLGCVVGVPAAVQDLCSVRVSFGSFFRPLR